MPRSGFTPPPAGLRPARLSAPMAGEGARGHIWAAVRHSWVVAGDSRVVAGDSREALGAGCAHWRAVRAHRTGGARAGVPPQPRSRSLGTPNPARHPVQPREQRLCPTHPPGMHFQRRLGREWAWDARLSALCRGCASRMPRDADPTPWDGRCSFPGMDIPNPPGCSWMDSAHPQGWTSRISQDAAGWTMLIPGMQIPQPRPPVPTHRPQCSQYVPVPRQGQVLPCLKVPPAPRSAIPQIPAVPATLLLLIPVTIPLSSPSGFQVEYWALFSWRFSRLAPVLPVQTSINQCAASGSSSFFFPSSSSSPSFSSSSSSQRPPAFPWIHPAPQPDPSQFPVDISLAPGSCRDPPRTPRTPQLHPQPGETSASQFLTVPSAFPWKVQAFHELFITSPNQRERSGAPDHFLDPANPKCGF